MEMVLCSQEVFLTISLAAPNMFAFSILNTTTLDTTTIDSVQIESGW